MAFLLLVINYYSCSRNIHLMKILTVYLLRFVRYSPLTNSGDLEIGYYIISTLWVQNPKIPVLAQCISKINSTYPTKNITAPEI